jgi:hypothetical protein
VVSIDKPTCLLKECSNPPEPLARPRAEVGGGIGFCAIHDRFVTGLVDGRRHTFKNAISLEAESWVYFFEGTPRKDENGVLAVHGPGPFIKIGSTRAILGRMSAYAGCLLLVEPGGRQHEGDLQLHFWESRAAGEWFWPTEDLMAYIRAGQRRLVLTEVRMRSARGVLHIVKNPRSSKSVETYCGKRLLYGSGPDSVATIDDATCKRCLRLFRANPEEVPPPPPLAWRERNKT